MAQDFNYWANRPLNDKGDWLDEDGDWIRHYWDSKDHPHRRLIIDAIRNAGDVRSVLELGSCCGPNLKLIEEELGIPQNDLSGIDANADAIAYGKQMMPLVDFKVGDIRLLQLDKNSFDAVLCDASLMYVAPNDIAYILEQVSRIARRAVIIIDRYAESLEGELTSGGHIWARNYEPLLAMREFEVTKTKIRRDDWPTSERWIQDGWVWAGIKP